MGEAIDRSFEIENLEFIAVGKSGIVYSIDEAKVVKKYDNPEDYMIECDAYERLSLHLNIPTRYHSPDGYLVIKRGQSLRDIYKQKSVDLISLPEKVNWLIHAARGIEHAHNQNIIHADVGCHNIIVAQDNIAKVIDFEGCSIDGGAATSCYEWFSDRRSTILPDKQSDIFAFGCAVYETITGLPPYHEYIKCDNRTEIIKDLYSRNVFPGVQHLPLGPLMENCWHDRYKSMSEIICYLQSVACPKGRYTRLVRTLRRLVGCFQ